MNATSWRLAAAVIALLAGSAGLSAEVHPPGSTAAAPPDTVFVAPPTGVREADRASILAALEQVRPGGTVAFAPGTYLIGELINVAVPGVTLLGHTGGTTLRGCTPTNFEDLERAFATVVTGEGTANGPDPDACGVLRITGGHQTVRDLTFEYSWWGLGMESLTASEWEAVAGGHHIVGNTFRSSMNGVRGISRDADTTVIRRNRFIDIHFAVSVVGSSFHVLENDITVTDPRAVIHGHPGAAISLGAVPPAAAACEHNVIAGSRIEGHPAGIMVYVRPPGSCRQNVIRDKAITVRKVPFEHRSGGFWLRIASAADSSIVGVPLTLGVEQAERGSSGGVLEETLVEGNRILGAEGLGIQIVRGSRNRIVNNSITGIASRDPFPGNTLGGGPERWRMANGSGFWASPGSDENEIVGNIFSDIASDAIVLQGDSNRVECGSASDAVRDLGSGNRVSVAQAAADAPAVAAAAPIATASGSIATGSNVVQDTLRYTLITGGHPKGERRVWREGPGMWRYEHVGRSYDSYHSPGTERLEMDADGLPVRVEISLESGGGPDARWEERFELREGRASWSISEDGNPASSASRRVEHGEGAVTGPAYYDAIHRVHDLGVLARALLRQPARTLPLLPDGEARLDTLARRIVEVDGRSRAVWHYAIHGILLRPLYVWLDEDGATFADEWSVLMGWEAAFPELRAEMEAALAGHHRRLARELVPPARERPLVIRGARLFDPSTHEVREGMTIVVEGSRVGAVAPDESLAVPSGAEIIEAAGRMVVPGLWDMHAHHGIPSPDLELDAPLNLAAGVTMARDLGSHTEQILALRERIEAGEAIGTRLILAGFIDGPGGRPSGVLGGNAEEARAIVDRFAELGYAQIKIYQEMPPELVPVLVERAKHHGMRVSGHVPNGMNAREVLEGGFDEIQHLLQVIGNLGPIPSPVEDLDAFYDWFSELTADSEVVRSFLELMVSRDAALDPTLAGFLWWCSPPDWVGEIAGRLPSSPRRRFLVFSSQYECLPPHSRRDEALANLVGVVRAAHEAGVPVLPGTDFIAGLGLHAELIEYARAGIPAPEVLTLATLGAARVMGMDDELGSVEPGKLADLILVDGDPTQDIGDIRRVALVVKDGRVYDPAAIYRALGIRPCCDD
jgi:hypothetical protein